MPIEEGASLERGRKFDQSLSDVCYLPLWPKSGLSGHDDIADIEQPSHTALWIE
jgi:hypothetical protein